MESLYELHINIDYSQLLQAQLYCLDKQYKYLILYSPQQTKEQGDEKEVNQFILTKWKYGTKEQAIQRAVELTNEIGEKFTTIRTKVEAPFEEPNALYYEYHLRVDVVDSSWFELLTAILDKYNGKYAIILNREKFHCVLTLSDNFRNAQSAPYGSVSPISKIESLENKKKLVEDLKLHGFFVHGKFHHEAVVYDTNREMDG